MNPVFEIIPEHQEANSTNLYCEISEDSLTYYFEDAENKKICGLTHYELPDRYDKGVASIKELLDQLQILRKTYNKVNVIYSFPEFVLSPYSMFKENDKSAVIEHMFGPEQEKTILSDSLNSIEIYNFYRVPLAIHHYITSHLPTANFSHEVTNLVKKRPEGTCMEVVFHQRKMVCALFIEGNIQLANSFYFKAAEDVIYHLLNICKQFETEVFLPIYLSGMIDIDSALAREIRKFFTDMRYKTHEALLNENMLHLPKHYFSHLFCNE